MLRRVENVSVGHQPGLFTGRGWFTLQVGKHSYRFGKIARDEFQAMHQGQQRVPVPVGRVGERTYWWFQDRFYWDNDNLAGEEVYALLVTRQQRERQRIQMTQALVAIGALPRPSSRVAIPDDVKQFVFARDGGRCKQCAVRQWICSSITSSPSHSGVGLQPITFRFSAAPAIAGRAQG